MRLADRARLKDKNKVKYRHREEDARLERTAESNGMEKAEGKCCEERGQGGRKRKLQAERKNATVQRMAEKK